MFLARNYTINWLKRRFHALQLENWSGIWNPNVSVLLPALKACSTLRDWETAKKLHNESFDHHSNIFITTALVNMYAKCGDMAEARKLFDAMSVRDIASWNALIIGYVENGENQLALELFSSLELEPNARTLVGAFMACTSLERGMSLHLTAAERALDTDVYVGNAIVNMYMRCGSVVDARRVFDKMELHDVVSWNSLLMGYVENGEASASLELFSQLNQELRDARSFVAALTACSNLATQEDGDFVKMKCLESGMGIHTELWLEQDVFLGNALMDMYMKSGSTLDARMVFDTMKCHNVVSWNVLLLGYAEKKESRLVLELLPLVNCGPDARTLFAGVCACANLEEEDESKLERVRDIHLLAATHGFDLDMFVANALIDMYGKSGSMSEASSVFYRMPKRDVVSWTSLMLGYIEDGNEEHALEVFQHMEAVPNARTYVAAFTACANLASRYNSKERLVERGMEMHSQAAKTGCLRDIFVANALVNMYVRCGSVFDARRVFDCMSFHDTVTWNSLITGYVENAEAALALEVFRCCGFPNSRTYAVALAACGRLLEGNNRVSCLDRGMVVHSRAVLNGLEHDLFVANALVSMYVRCGSMFDARGVFDRVFCHNLVSWNTLIAGYVDNGENSTACELFVCLRLLGITPDAGTLVPALGAYGNLADVENGVGIVAYICRQGLEVDPVLATSVVEFYGRAGFVVSAQCVFDWDNDYRDVIMWNALLSVHSRGNHGVVLKLFQEMHELRVARDRVSFLNVLNACNHAGDVEYGRKCFELMANETLPSVQHYTCMVDLFGRANKIDEAVEMLKNMPHKPDVVTWMAILSACRKWNNVQVGKSAFDGLIELDEDLAAAYSLMANTYCS